MSGLSLTSRRLRMLAWSGLALIVGFRVALEFAPVDPRAQILLGDLLTYLAPLALAALTAGVLALRVDQRVERRFWGLLSVACLSMLIGESYWTWYIVSVDAVGPSLTSPVQLSALFSATCFALVVATMTAAGASSLAYRIRLYLDVVAVMAIVYPVIYLRWTLPLFEGFSAQLLLAGRTALWPLFGLAMVAVIAAVVGGYKAGSWKTWERFVVAAISTVAIGLITYPTWYAEALAAGDTSVGWYGVVLGSGVYLLVIGAVYRLTSEEGGAFAEPWPLELPDARRLAWAYPIVLSAALPLLAWLAFALSESGAEGPVLTAAIVLALALAARSWLLAVEIADHRVSAITDPATGLFNARYLDERLLQLAEESRGPGQPLALLVLRIDDFARIDALHGRMMGDRLVMAVAEAVTDTPPAGAEAFRSRSDEFVVVMPSASRTEAEALAHALLDRMERGEFPKAVPASLSIGVAVWSADSANAADLLTRARVACEAASRSQFEQVMAYSVELDLVHTESPAALAPVRRLSTAVRSLADAADERDPLTAGHSRRVAGLAEKLARALELPAERVEALRLAASVHDVGKLGVGRAALTAPAPLGEAHQRDFERHPVVGARILRALGLAEVSEAVLHHHEQWDGTGYPEGLAAEAIPLEARVLAICDVYDAMVSGRAGWQTLQPEAAREGVLALAGTAFDPDLVATFVERVAPGLPTAPVLPISGEPHQPSAS